MFHSDALIANSTRSVFCFSDEGEPNDQAIVFYYSCSPSCLFAFSILHLCFDPSLFDMVSALLFISSKCVWVNLPVALTLFLSALYSHQQFIGLFSSFALQSSSIAIA